MIRSLGHFLWAFGRQLPTTVGLFIAWHPKHSWQFLHTLPALQTIVSPDLLALGVRRRVLGAVLDDAEVVTNGEVWEV